MDLRYYVEHPDDSKVMDIEYSVLGEFYNFSCPEGNTELHFRKSIEYGFDGLKADMRFTRDGEIVLCHDAGFTLDADGRIGRFDRGNFVAIRDMPLEEVLRLEFAAPFDGRRLHPCTLDTMLGLCRKHGKVAYLTLRPEPWREEVAQRMTELIVKHDMQRQTIVNLFPGCKEAMDSVEKLLPGLVYCNTRRPGDALTEELMDDSAEQGYKILCLCRRMIDSVTREKCRYAARKGLHVWIWDTENAKECAYDLAKGITGFQMFSKDVTPAVIDGILAAQARERAQN